MRSSPLTSWTTPKSYFRTAVAWIAFFSYGTSCREVAVAPSLRTSHRDQRPQRRRLDPGAPTNTTHRTRARERSPRSLLGGIHLERTTYKLSPAVERNLVDWDAAPAAGTAALPVFWHVLKSGGTTIKLMYAQCYHLVEACETGALIAAQQRHPESGPAEGTPQQEEPPQAPQDPSSDPQPRWDAAPGQTERLRVVVAEDGRRYVDVDTTTPDGIRDAARRGFAASNLTDVLFTPLLSESAAALLGGPAGAGRLFSLFRHPVERVASIFYYLQGATWEPTYNPEYAQWTLDDYAHSPYCESNWMVRSLTNKMTGALSADHFELAKELLRRKCLVGLMEGVEESVARFHAVLRVGDARALQCALERFARKGRAANSHPHPALEQTSATWAVLAQKNQLDIRLYEFAQQLFEEQGKWLKREQLI